ncbi:DUF397 domain-containing protein [Microtetraspora malaysiensis]|uniref:DUF397 domain-containing protein n=1 Tax=Microtetraspora malaysiensis TaxID=161358 RepID=UPI000A84DAC8|nr:DUF397 domain-containing protein [Microtetraspora malaysiensis]
MEVAGNLPDIIAIRDSKSPELLFRPAEWPASISGVKDGDSTEHLKSGTADGGHVRLTASPFRGVNPT